MERFYRRRLPHWRLDAPGVLYFVTWRLALGQPDLDRTERDLVASVITHWDGTRCRLSAWVVMNDHAHIVVATLGEWRLDDLLHSCKSYAAHQLVRACGREAPVWQEESFDRIIRSDGEMSRTVKYVCGNPLKRWPVLTDYRWVWPGLRAIS